MLLLDVSEMCRVFFVQVNTYMMRRYAGGIFALDRKADLLRAAFRSAVGEQPQPPAAKYVMSLILHVVYFVF